MSFRQVRRFEGQAGALAWYLYRIMPSRDARRGVGSARAVSCVPLCFLLGTLCLFADAQAATAPGTGPNIIVLLADDMGWGDLRAYNPASRIEMPALERLAAQGIRFTDAHSTPKCAPSRYSLLTGNYHWRGTRPWGTWGYFGGSQIPQGQLTLGSILGEAGYETAFIGKLHLGGDFYEKGSNTFVPNSWPPPEDRVDFARPFRNGPLDFGFDHSYLVLRGVQQSPYAYFEDDRLVGDPDSLITWPVGTYGASKTISSGIGMPDWDSSEVGGTLTAKALDFIDRVHQQNLAAGTHRPFFLFYSSQAAHAPQTPPETLLGEPVNGVTRMEPRADMIYSLDVTLAKLMDALEARGLADDTLIIFTSDNGAWRSQWHADTHGHDRLGGLAGQKGLIEEGGHRVPFVARWGDGTPEGSVIPPGTASGQLIALQDLVATVAALTNRPLPVDQARDSVSFLPSLLGQEDVAEPGRMHLVLESRERLVDGEMFDTAPYFALRELTWKLVLDENDDVSGFFDLTKDLGEINDLKDNPTHGDRIAQMHATLLAQRVATRTAPANGNSASSNPSVQGRPSFRPGIDRGVYVWKDFFDGPYHVRVNGDGSKSLFRLELLGERPFEDVTRELLEANDRVTWSGNHVLLTGELGMGQDGIDIRAPVGSRMLLSIELLAQQQPLDVYSGASSSRLPTSAWILDADALPTLPAFEGGKDAGVFLGRGATGDELSVRWNGDGAPHDIHLHLLFSSPVGDLVALGLEPNDVLQSSDLHAEVDGKMGSWWDGLDVVLAFDTRVGLNYLYDGLEQPLLLNPTTGGLGAPDTQPLPVPTATSRPAHDPARDKGLFVWKDPGGGWHLRVTAGGDFERYTGTITVSAEFTGFDGVLLEPNDFLESQDPLTISFDLLVRGQGVDGIDFTVPDGTRVELGVNGNSNAAAGLVIVGEERWPVSTLPVLLSP